MYVKYISIYLNNDIDSINKNVIDIDNIMELLEDKGTISKTTINNNLIKLNELMTRKRQLSQQLLAPPTITKQDYESLLSQVKG